MKTHKKKRTFVLVGIKNSWKYEKDLIHLFNANNVFTAITHPGSIIHHPEDLF